MTRFAFGPALRNPFWALCGALIGAAIMLAVSAHNHNSDIASAVEKVRADEMAARGPVVIAASEIRGIDVGGVNVHLGPVDKLRDCDYRGMQAFFATQTAGMQELSANRIDTPETRATKPIGKFATFGIWRLTPRMAGTGKLMMFINYNCDGLTIVTRVADLQNPQ